jgi:hypothetical protein
MNQFYAVKWGVESGNPQIRISDKVSSPRAACRNCWGMVADNMWVKPLGTRAAPLRVHKWRTEQLTSKVGWCRMSRRNLEVRLKGSRQEAFVMRDDCETLLVRVAPESVDDDGLRTVKAEEVE